MDVCEPHVRRRGFFLHSDTTGEVETGEHENPEGFVVRVRIAQQPHSRHNGSSSARRTQLVGLRSDDGPESERLPQIRSGSVTGSRQRSHSHR